jgi:hypothetical protein
MRDIRLQQVVDRAFAMRPTVQMRGMQLPRPIDVVKAPSLSSDDKRTILAAWASDFYAVDSKLALRQLPGTPEPVPIDEFQSALANSMGAEPEMFRLGSAVFCPSRRKRASKCKRRLVRIRTDLPRPVARSCYLICIDDVAAGTGLSSRNRPNSGRGLPLQPALRRS